MKKLQEPRKKWWIYGDYILFPASTFFTIYNYIERDIAISIFMLFLAIMSLQRLIKDRKITK